MFADAPTAVFPVPEIGRSAAPIRAFRKTAPMKALSQATSMEFGPLTCPGEG